ncbi:transcription factor involved in cell cycle dependent gene expression [Scheffersomyces stipitis CBS 6054]|uniref:Transcription factor involved in cell cycle dependent gene expression n=1 Tax=Scheffersomyces stipitis (strain ATCC 58785 / CBS 6054 / NBRC 10063 / NRRL Y-11545) TaxID=322104 RepID=A3GHS0_PICST|nr:transcription factor involved in cell cycle dependent gene expression [Scheffersomyces stipitis CBS 6054]EAZ63102.2 transcription factor involved in cell cycle dependent gene expression [Scheffersomyces stipitis CBS 6054]KAG2734961.1 hypothetical protein G9P44_001175 [Scheffersomyces stipitis]
MESPLHIGDLTTNSISHRLNDTHLTTSCSSSVSSAIYSGQKVIQLTLNFQVGTGKLDNTVVILRRVQDSYVNVTQLFGILLKLGHFNETQLNNFFNNEIVTNIQLQGAGTKNNHFLDLRKHENTQLRGLWISYDRAVALALQFDIYEFTKGLFLVDVHDFDKLPKTNKRFYEGDDDEDGSLAGSPTKKQKVSKEESETRKNEKDIGTANVLVDELSAKNVNYPLTLPPVASTENELANELKVKLGEVFKRDDEFKGELGINELRTLFQPILTKYEPNVVVDIPLDQKGQTALHFASTLASVNLVSGFIELGLNNPVRGNNAGESPLISAIQVTNAMEKGIFQSLLTNWLYPDIWLLDNKRWSFMHHLTSDSAKKIDSSKFYCTKILEYIVAESSRLKDFQEKLLNSQDEEGNTSLHFAAEKESSWFVKILLKLNADVNISNKRGVKPIDFDLVKDMLKPESDEQFDEYIFELIHTGLEFLDKRLQINDEIPEIEAPKVLAAPVAVSGDDSTANTSNRIFQSIQHLLANTNVEYEAILNAKREQISNLNKSLHDATIVTANNRFLTRKVTEKLIELDNLKLQSANITDRLQLTKQEFPEDQEEDGEVEKQFDADEPFAIKPLYEKLVKDESIEDLRENEEVLKQLQPVPILKARINAYKQINAQIEKELNTLLDYSELASKFKKVVSICTGVDINEVDELLDGLLEAVEGQQ